MESFEDMDVVIRRLHRLTRGRRGRPQTKHRRKPGFAHHLIAPDGFFGMVVNPTSIGHFTSPVSPQNGHVTSCETSVALLNGPETVKVFRHFVHVMIFSISSRHSFSQVLMFEQDAQYVHSVVERNHFPLVALSVPKFLDPRVNRGFRNSDSVR